MNEQLKSCPFCGSRKVVIYKLFSQDVQVQICARLQRIWRNGGFMKTLDEVITVLDGCFLKSRKEWCVENCPYLQNDEQTCRRDVLNDALHYLKTYRANQRTYEENSLKAEEARERYIEAVKNCELAENKYRKLTEETSQKLRNTSQITCPKCHSEFMILPEANNALTWDELKQMEGKPVWVEILSDEIDLSSRWMMVARETKAHSLPLAYTDHMGHWIYGHEDDLGKTWNAYRREKDATIQRTES